MIINARKIPTKILIEKTTGFKMMGNNTTNTNIKTIMITTISQNFSELFLNGFLVKRLMMKKDINTINIIERISPKVIGIVDLRP